MKRYHLLLRCIGGAVADHGVRCLLGAIPFAEKLYEIAKDAYERYRQECEVAERLAQVEAIAHASLEDVRQEVADAVQEIQGQASPEVRQQLQNPSVHLALVSYLQQVPASIRSSLRRPADPSGRSVPPGFKLQSPEELLRLLPARLPRFKPGDRPIGHWELEELLGVGGFGEVWRARHPRLKNLPPVALKFCLDEESARYLRHEAALIDQMMTHSRQPGVVELRNAYLEADPPCLEYEFVAGGDLCGVLHDWSGLAAVKRVEQTTRLIGKLASILAPLHRLNPPIVHRDLKPANILLAGGTGDGSDVKIADFGIGGVSARQALIASRGTVSRGDLMSQTLRGSHTPLYASPEQVWGGEPDPRDDVHALGVIWYQLLVGDLRRGCGTDMDDELRDLAVPEEVIGLVRKCVGRAERRFADAGVLAQRLAELKPVATPPGVLPAPVLPQTTARQQSIDSLPALRNAPAYLERGQSFRMKGEHDKAIADCTEAIRLDPSIWQTYFNRGESYRMKNNYDKAIADCTEAIRLDPRCWLAYGTRGCAFRQKGDFSTAIADLKECLRLNADSAWGKEQLDFAKRGQR